MLDLTDVSLVLFDFDDTLCLHTRRPQSKELPNERYSEDIFAGRNPWQDGVAPEVMKSFVRYCDKLGITMGLMSGTSSYLRAQKKVEWVKDFYGVTMENYCVNGQEFKLVMMQDLCRHFECEPMQILLVDDIFDNLERASEAGFYACSPMEVVYFMEQIGKCTCE